jgi:hypothetical protein
MPITYPPFTELSKKQNLRVVVQSTRRADNPIRRLRFDGQGRTGLSVLRLAALCLGACSGRDGQMQPLGQFGRPNGTPRTAFAT